MAEMTPALPWLLAACKKAGKGPIQNLDARAVLRAIAEAERAAVQAKHERTKEACAKVAEAEAEPGEPDEAQRRMIDAQDPADLVNVAVKQAKRNIAAAIRAMPEQGAERGKEPQIKTPKPEPLPWRIGKVSFY